MRHNVVNPYDIDGSGQSVPLDALWIANQLNANQARGDLWLDVNNDGVLSSADFEAEVHYLDVLAAASGDADSLHGAAGAKPAAGQGGGNTKPTYQYWVSGDAADANVAPLSGGLGLVGGGTTPDELFQWLGSKANGGDFLVLTASGNGYYDPYIRHLVPSLDSVATLLVPDRASAFDPFVAETIRQAEAIFITGGDQSRYVNFWNDTPLESAIYDALARHAPLGGTSAGLAVLGDYDFSAVIDTITSPEALANPYDSRITLDGGFLNPREFATAESNASGPLALLANTITDSHFQQRDRMGRLLTFVARLDADSGDTVPNGAARGIGVNESTALEIEEDGTARVVGSPYAKNIDPAAQQRSVYLIDTNGNRTPAVLSAPLSTQSSPASKSFDFRVARLDYDPITGSSDSVNLLDWGNWSGLHTYSISVVNGTLVTSPPGSVY